MFLMLWVTRGLIQPSVDFQHPSYLLIYVNERALCVQWHLGFFTLSHNLLVELEIKASRGWRPCSQRSSSLSERSWNCLLSAQTLKIAPGAVSLPASGLRSRWNAVTSSQPQIGCLSGQRELWLDAYHNHILSLVDGVTFTLSARDAIAGRGGHPRTFPDAFFHTFRHIKLHITASFVT